MSTTKHPRVNKLGPLQIILLAIPCIAVLIVPFYNRVEPSLFGIPFLYLWLFAWVPLSSVFIGLVYRMVVPAQSDDLS